MKDQSGVGFLGLLTLLFIGLKLTDHIDWSWWWVLAPLWGPFAAIVALAVALGAIYLLALAGEGIFAALEKLRARRRQKNIRYRF